MIYGLFVGIIMGVGNAPVAMTLLTIPALLSVKAGYEILMRKSWLTGDDSDYVLYVREIEKTETAPARLWVSYTVQLLLFGSLVGYAAFFAARAIIGDP